MLLLRSIYGQLYQLMLQLFHYGYPQRLYSSHLNSPLHPRLLTHQLWQTCFFSSVPCSHHPVSLLSTAHQLQLSFQSQTASLWQSITWPTFSFKSSPSGTTWSICRIRDWTCYGFERGGGGIGSRHCPRGVIAVREAILLCSSEMVRHRRLKGWPRMLSSERVRGDTIRQCAISTHVIPQSKAVALAAQLAFIWQALVVLPLWLMVSRSVGSPQVFRATEASSCSANFMAC